MDQATLVIVGLIVTIVLSLIGHVVTIALTITGQVVTIVLTVRQQRETQLMNQRTTLLNLDQQRETQRMNQHTIELALGQLQETRHMSQRTSWHESSRQLPSERAAERAVGMAAAIDYLHDSQLGKPALRVALDRLQYEDDPLIVYRARQALSDARLLPSAVGELLAINRHVWRHLLEEFASTCLDPEGPPRDLKPHLEKLERNQRSMSYLLQRGSFEGLDFSDTFYPDLQAPRVTFTGCNFSSSLLHYSNFHEARFNNCDLSRCILIGSYLEAATLPPEDERTKMDVVDHTARYHSEGDNQDLLSTPPSFMREAEQGWYGHWTEAGEPRRRFKIGTTERTFKAVWPNPSDRSKAIKGTVVLKGKDGPFVRRGTGNDGTYEIISRNGWFMLDRKRSITLVGGTRTLVRRVPSVWWGIWWQQLGSRPTQIMPIPDHAGRQRGA